MILFGFVDFLDGLIMRFTASLVGDALYLGGYVANLLDDDLVTLTCEHCGEETQARVRVLRQNRHVACLACDVPLDYSAAKFRHDTEHRAKVVGD